MLAAGAPEVAHLVADRPAVALLELRPAVVEAVWVAS